MHIALDIDGVLADFTYGWRRLAAKHYGTDVYSCGGQTEWEFNDLRSRQQQKHLWSIIDETDFWRNLFPLVAHGEVEHLREFARTHDLSYVTSRQDTANTLQQTEDWLEAHGFPQPHSVYMGSDKGPILASIHADALLDDNPKHMKAVTECQVWVRDWPYNREIRIPGDRTLPRVGSLSEFLRRVEQER